MRRDPVDTVVDGHSRWWEMFRVEPGPDEQVWVSCVLEDGTYLGGALGSFSTAAEEDQDRDLVLVGPVEHRAPGEEEAVVFDPAQSVIVSSRRLLYLGVGYTPR